MKKLGRVITRMRSEGQLPKEYKNAAEQACAKELTAQGWFVTKKGWPDFACFKGDKLALVEVKQKSSHRLKRDQFRLLTALAKLGVNCFLWSPEQGLQPIPFPHTQSKQGEEES